MVISAGKGFSLIEVLVSVFILTTGLMAALGLHLTALRTAQQSAFQTKAMHLAVEMAESMRAKLVSTSAQLDMPGWDGTCAQANTSCEAAAFSTDEMGVWLQRVAEELPAGQARICRDDSPWDVSGDQLRWECAAENVNGSGPLVIKIGWQDKTASSEEQPDVPKLALVVQAAPR